ncbi:MAG: RNA polymerase sigma factor [Sphingobacteriales bacterium]|nr:RNA polymerase sigma factor [Sphingobacteriales bacterium]
MFGKLFAKKTEEQQLIEGCIQGDARSTTAFYKRFSAKMFGVCMRYAKDRFVAEDIFQEAFIKVFNGLPTFRGEGSLEGWVRRIFVNTAIEHYRRHSNLYPIMEVQYAVQEEWNDHIVEQMSAEELLSLIDKLSVGYRTIFNLYVVEGYSHKEIANMLNISEGTSKSQLARAKSLLRQMIEQQEPKQQREKYV